MKFNFDGVHIDLLYAQLAISVIPPDFNIFDNSNLRNVDPKSVLSLNGPHRFAPPVWRVLRALAD